MSHNAERLVSFLEREAAEYLKRHAALPEGAFVSVSRVDMNASLERAEIFVLIFPESQSKEIFAEIKRLEKETKRYISKRLSRHKIPNIVYKNDAGGSKQARVEKLLDEIK